MINVVLFEPEIPMNTGNIMRTCIATNAKLHLIKPLGFSLDEKSVRRSGVNYIDKIDLTVYENIEDFYSKNDGTFYYLTTKAKKLYTEIEFKEGDFIVFGPETRGLPDKYVKDENARTIPMKEGQRSLNLSNSVAIVAYEAVRQNGL